MTVAEFLMDWLPKQCRKHKWAPKTYCNAIQRPTSSDMENTDRAETVHPWLTKQKAMKSFDPQLPRQTFPDGDPRALNNSPPGCCLPRLRLGRAVRVPSTHKKERPEHNVFWSFLVRWKGLEPPAY